MSFFNFIIKNVDVRTEIEYRVVGDYYLLNLVLKQEENVMLNKYGRLNYLKEYKKNEYIIMCIEGNLNNHLKKYKK